MVRISGCGNIINMVMKPEEKRSERKPTRIKNYDYSSVGAYFVTIYTQIRKEILSEIIRTNNAPVSGTNDYAVEERLAPPVCTARLKPCGEAAETTYEGAYT